VFWAENEGLDADLDTNFTDFHELGEKSGEMPKKRKNGDLTANNR